MAEIYEISKFPFSSWKIQLKEIMNIQEFLRVIIWKDVDRNPFHRFFYQELSQ
jgi:hypothetical protein